MRALPSTAIFLVAIFGFAGAARAKPPARAPRFSLLRTFDWNKVAAARPRLTVTAAAPAATPLEAVALGRAEELARQVAMPHYLAPDVEHRQQFRQLYLSPYSPYYGAYGLALTVESDALLR